MNRATTYAEIWSYATTYAYGRVDALSGQHIDPEEVSQFARHCANGNVGHGGLQLAFNTMFPKWATKR